MKTSSCNHATTISCASMSRSARKVSSSITTCCNNSLESFHSVKGAISHVVGHDSSTLSVFHDQIKSKILNEENAVISKSSSEQSMKHAMSSSISYSTASISLTTFSKLLRLSSESSLIDLSFFCSRERHSI